MVSNVAQAEEKIRNRLHRIEAALADINSSNDKAQTGWTRATDPLAFERLRNRTASLLLNIYHLKHDARGFARAKAIDERKVDDFCTASHTVSLCIKAGDTHKHGIGGRAGNNVVMEYDAIICAQQGAEPSPDDPVVHVSKLIIDEVGEPHQAETLAIEAVRDWPEFLGRDPGMDVAEWQAKWEARPLSPDQSVYKGQLPPELLAHFKSNALARAKEK